jgi:hypothetical protein
LQLQVAVVEPVVGSVEQEPQVRAPQEQGEAMAKDSVVEQEHPYQEVQEVLQTVL